MLAFFPYLKTSEPVRYRSVVLRSNDDPADLSSDESARLREIGQMFFLQDHHRIRRMSYAFLDDARTADLTAFQHDLHELRELLAYAYSAPHRTFGDPFLRSEHTTVYVFRAKRIFRSLVESSEDTIAVQPAHYPEADEREQIRGYECEVDGRSMRWVARGSRIDPPCVRLWLNLSQDIELAAPTPDALDLPARAAERFQLSARAHERILRVARAIADLDTSDIITDDHVAEALAFR